MYMVKEVCIKLEGFLRYVARSCKFGLCPEKCPKFLSRLRGL